MTSDASPPGPVLFVDDEADLREAAAQALSLAEIDVRLCASAAEALPHLSAEFPGILVIDIRMPSTDGTALMRAALERDARDCR
jgi:two-component system C4-dicarboxylate transport response regulator DctD